VGESLQSIRAGNRTQEESGKGRTGLPRVRKEEKFLLRMREETDRSRCKFSAAKRGGDLKTSREELGGSKGRKTTTTRRMKERFNLQIDLSSRAVSELTKSRRTGTKLRRSNFKLLKIFSRLAHGFPQALKGMAWPSVSEEGV